ncbi:MAG: SUMF1/EgtB/PvdO family nonheme iron enzyme [Bacteriovoracia bacterium]
MLPVTLVGQVTPQSPPKSFQDMTFVNAPEASFYMDIFEASISELAYVLPEANVPTGRSGINPPRLEYETAVQYCAAQGKRIPTQAEWLTAGSNLGQNKSYTLEGDKLEFKPGQPQANVGHTGGGSSVDVTDYNHAGVDAIGAVGMTGNRNEWVLGPDGKPAQCGGHYQFALADVTLDKICKSTWDSGATVRCVVDYAEDIRIQLTSDVQGPVRALVLAKGGKQTTTTYERSHRTYYYSNSSSSTDRSSTAIVIPSGSGSGTYGGGSSAPRVVTGSGYSSSGTSGVSSPVGPAGQIISPRQLELEFSLPAGARASEVSLALVFEDGTHLDLGAVGTGYVSKKKLTLAQFQSLDKTHPLERARIGFLKNGELIKDERVGQPPVFIGGTSYDYKCQHPVLLADMHGTLDAWRTPENKQCFEDFVIANDVTIFLVSTTGTSAYADLQRQNLACEKNFIPLEVMGNGYGGEEKAARVRNSLDPTGACILGFVGETPEKEGTAAKLLDVPYLGVHQTNVTRIIGQKPAHKYKCERYMKDNKAYFLNEGGKCAELFEEQLWRELECVADTRTWLTSTSTYGQDQQVIVKAWASPGSKATDEALCEGAYQRREAELKKEKSQYPNMRVLFKHLRVKSDTQRTVCVTSTEGVLDRADEKEECPKGYSPTRETSYEPIYGDPSPAFSVKDYPPGSLYSENWCSLVDQMTTQFKLKRREAPAGAHEAEDVK